MQSQAPRYNWQKQKEAAENPDNALEYAAEYPALVYYDSKAKKPVANSMAIKSLEYQLGVLMSLEKGMIKALMHLLKRYLRYTTKKRLSRMKCSYHTTGLKILKLKYHPLSMTI